MSNVSQTMKLLNNDIVVDRSLINPIIPGFNNTIFGVAHCTTYCGTFVQYKDTFPFRYSYLLLLTNKSELHYTEILDI